MFKNRYKSHEGLVLLFRFSVLMLIYSLTRVAFYFFNTEYFPAVSTDDFFTILIGGLRFDLTALIYINALYFVLYLPPYPWKFKKIYRQILKSVFLVTNLIGIIANSADIIYYRFTLRRTTIGVFKDFSNESNMLTLLTRFIFDFWYITLLVLFLFVFLIYIYKIVSVKEPSRKSDLKYYLTSILIFLVFVYFSIVGMRSGFTRTTRPINMSNAGKYVKDPSLMVVVQNTPFCFLRTLGKKSFKKLNLFKNREELNTYFNPLKDYQEKFGQGKDKNVVVIILESFTREVIGSLNRDLENSSYQGYTPFLDSLVTHSLVFENGFANGKKSIDAMPSVLASIPSFVQPYISSEYANNKINSLASTLNELEYSTSFFHGAPTGSMGFDSFAKIAGFQHYFGEEDYEGNGGFDGYWGISDDDFLQFMAKKLKELPKPFFSSVFTLSSHHPFLVPKGFENKFPKGKKNVHECVGYTDYSLKHFFDTIKAEPWYQNTLFVITADHTSSPYYDKYRTKMNRFAVPIIFYTPDGSLQGRSKEIAQQSDIMPTILAYLGYNKPFVAFGNNLLDSLDHNFAVNYLHGNYQLTINDYLIRFNGKKITEAFNSKADPALEEKVDLAKVPEKYKNTIKAIVQEYNNRIIDNEMSVK